MSLFLIVHNNVSEGTPANIGVVNEVCDSKPNSWRSCVLVKWKKGSMAQHNRGHQGKVDVKCTEAANGEVFYIDHLPTLRMMNAIYLLFLNVV